MTVVTFTRGGIKIRNTPCLVNITLLLKNSNLVMEYLFYHKRDDLSATEQYLAFFFEHQV